MNNYLKTLARKRMGSGVLIFSEKDELLIVKISYKEHWSIPGGVVEENESPKQAGIREVKEEIGLEFKDIKFVCIDYTKADVNKNKDESLQFIFTAGKISNEFINKIQIDNKEVIEFAFKPVEQVSELLGGPTRNLVKRLMPCIEAIKNDKGIYLEDGIR